MVVIKILALLFLALLIIVPLVEKFGKKHSEEEVSKISRWILPLVALMLVIQGIMMLVR